MSRQLPYPDESSYIPFPPVSSATPEGIVAVGGNLSPNMLLSAYMQGIFPWFSEGDPILWWSPDPRCVLYPGEVHISRSMQTLLRRKRFRISFDASFPSVIEGCRLAPRRGQKGTWITESMRDAYIELHRLGYAHSVEVWDGEVLAGGMYGVSLGSCFFGESMFSKVQNASKAALIEFSRLMRDMGLQVLDCQVHSPHLESLGARQITREEFMDLLQICLNRGTLRGSWASILRDCVNR
jgi:leucyl/phenylalanyl-tRNA--protein transferase